MTSFPEELWTMKYLGDERGRGRTFRMPRRYGSTSRSRGRTRSGFSTASRTWCPVRSRQARAPSGLAARSCAVSGRDVPRPRDHVFPGQLDHLGVRGVLLSLAGAVVPDVPRGGDRRPNHGEITDDVWDRRIRDWGLCSMALRRAIYDRRASRRRHSWGRSIDGRPGYDRESAHLHNSSAAHGLFPTRRTW
jgi:hypothetical protein